MRHIRIARRLIPAVACALLAVLHTPAALAQAWPAKPIRLVVPFASGGINDEIARLISSHLGPMLGQPVVVENVTGASGNIGTLTVVRAAPDGYTLVTGTSSLITAPLLGLATPFNVNTDLVPVALTATTPSLLVTGADTPFKSVDDLVSQAKSRPGRFDYASAGVGTLGHLYGELLKSQAGISLTHIPYKGGAPALSDVMAGHVAVLFDIVGTSQAHVKSGRLRALAVTSAKRFPSLPDVPTMVEAGYPEFTATAWFSILAPAATPREVVNRLNTSIDQVLKQPDVVDALVKMGVTAEGGPPSRHTALFDAETRRWTKLIQSANIKGE